MENLANITPAITLSPLDGRYRHTTAPLVNYLSEAALNRARIKIEIEWLIFLSCHQILPGAPTLTETEIEYLRAIPENYNSASITELAEIEAETRHDVKAVEYYVKRRLDSAPKAIGESTSLPRMHEIVHIFCTSEDINNLAHALTIKSAVTDIWLPAAQKFLSQLKILAQAQSTQPMLARTHGQNATPTTLGKEIAVFAWRISRQLKSLEKIEYLAKFNGATGTFGAHFTALPNADWESISKEFVESLGLSWNPLTTQIESHDWAAELFAVITHFNRIAHNLATDFWTYISMGYFKQNLAAQGSTGSSTMPHKVNPIRFENAEANLEISSALFDTLAATLVTSRLQRDLTDSSTQRNIGVAFGHSLLAIENLQRGLAGLDANSARMEEDLADAWEVLGEPIQQAMRVAEIAGVKGLENPYERLKHLTRGQKVTAKEMREFIASLNLPADTEERLLKLSPATYTGLASKLVKYISE